jgi:hypothetical protein
MPEWIAGLLVVVIVLQGVTLWLWRKTASFYRLMVLTPAKIDHVEKQVMATHELLAQHVAPAMGMILRDRDDLKELLVEALEKKPEEHPLTGLAFLPTDQSAADLERDVKRAEDHAISAGDPIRYSSRPSPTSAQPSRRAPSTQRVPRSGPR